MSDVMARPTTEPGPSGQLREDLQQWLPASCFPATAERLMADLMRRGAPSRLIWAISSHCSQHQRIDGVERLAEVLAAPAPAQPPGHPAAG